MGFHSGIVSIMGRPNVGKSTLLNQILQHKVSITTPVAQTTRNNIRGVYEDENCQIIFVDTPGLHTPKQLLDRNMVREAWTSLQAVDAVLLVIDAQKGFVSYDQKILERLKKEEIPIILVVNKVDAVSKNALLEQIVKLHPDDFADIVPVSAVTGDNVDELIRVIQKYLPNDEKLVEDERMVEQPEKFRFEEIIREKLMLLTRQEIPASIAVHIENMEFKKNSVIIDAVILVDKDSAKGIVIGKSGSLLKEAGTQARKELEELLGKKVFLQLFVRVQKDWRNQSSSLKELGYTVDSEEDE